MSVDVVNSVATRFMSVSDVVHSVTRFMSMSVGRCSYYYDKVYVCVCLMSFILFQKCLCLCLSDVVHSVTSCL